MPGVAENTFRHEIGDRIFFRQTKQYTVVSRARGHFAEVYGLRQGQSTIAAKVPSQRFAEHNPQVVEDFRKAGLYWQQLPGHPNILNVLGMYDDGELHYIATRLIRGWGGHVTLRDWIRSAQLSMKGRLSVLAQVAQLLDFLHKTVPGFRHGDIKPANILIDWLKNKAGDRGHPLAIVADFGLAEIATREQKVQPGTVLGDARYMPCALAGPKESASLQFDLYCLSSTIFETLTGLPPHLELGPAGERRATLLAFSPNQQTRLSIPTPLLDCLVSCFDTGSASASFDPILEALAASSPDQATTASVITSCSEPEVLAHLFEDPTNELEAFQRGHEQAAYLAGKYDLSSEHAAAVLDDANLAGRAIHLGALDQAKKIIDRLEEVVPGFVMLRRIRFQYLHDLGFRVEAAGEILECSKSFDLDQEAQHLFEGDYHFVLFLMSQVLCGSPSREVRRQSAGLAARVLDLAGWTPRYAAAFGRSLLAAGDWQGALGVLQELRSRAPRLASGRDYLLVAKALVHNLSTEAVDKLIAAQGIPGENAGQIRHWIETCRELRERDRLKANPKADSEWRMETKDEETRGAS